MPGTEFATRPYEQEAQEAKVIERIGGYYEAREVPFGVIYKCIQGICCSSADAARC